MVKRVRVAAGKRGWARGEVGGVGEVLNLSNNFHSNNL